MTSMESVDRMGVAVQQKLDELRGWLVTYSETIRSEYERYRNEKEAGREDVEVGRRINEHSKAAQELTKALLSLPSEEPEPQSPPKLHLVRKNP